MQKISKWVKDLYIRPEMIEYIEENKQTKKPLSGFSDVFGDLITEARKIKGKIIMIWHQTKVFLHWEKNPIIETKWDRK